jgi:hypothetical protein
MSLFHVPVGMKSGFRSVGFCLLVSLVAVQNVVAQEVQERGGNIYFRDSSGTEKALTSTRHDFSPSLSPDGSEVVFRRELRPATSNDVGMYELWIIQIASKEALRLLSGTQMGHELAPFGASSFSTPQFSPDGKFVYFLNPEAQTSDRVIRLNRQTRDIDVLIPGAIEFRVVPRGLYEGCIVVRLRKSAFVGEGLIPVYWYYLLGSDGREIGFLGKERSDVERFFLLLGK